MDTSSLVQAINEAAINHGSTAQPDKAKLIEACTSLIASFESVDQKLIALLFGPVKAIALRLGIDMHLFDVGSKALEKGETVTLQQMSIETKCEALLIKRVMRLLIEMKTFNETDQDVFQPQPIVALYKTDSPVAQMIIHFTTHMVQITKLPDYFAQKGYSCPNDAFDSPFQYAMGTTLHPFEWMAENPKHQHAFDVTMTMRAQRSGGPKWFEIYPVEQVLAQASASNPFVVDIGGGLGHHMIDLQKLHPNIPGKLVVQDIATVIDNVKDLPLGIEAMIHDFFKPQPVRLAHIYFLAHILHDWPDKQAKIVLEHVRDAMGPDSVLLLDETIMPERNVPYVPAVLDLTMMAAFSSLERTESQFGTLLAAVGLNLVQIWYPKEKGSNNLSLGQSVLEVRKL